jgi:hypothetical protein
LLFDLVEGVAEAAHGGADGVGVVVAGVGTDGGDGEVFVVGVEGAGGIPVARCLSGVGVCERLSEGGVEGDAGAPGAFAVRGQPLVSGAVGEDSVVGREGVPEELAAFGGVVGVAGSGGEVVDGPPVDVDEVGVEPVVAAGVDDGVGAAGGGAGDVADPVAQVGDVGGGARTGR